MKNFVILCLLLCIPVHSQEVDIDSEINQLTSFIQALQNFTKYIPQEKVYLHFDNTSYYQGDHIWFKCYEVASTNCQLSNLSKTLYVELLNPGGEIVDKRILKIENGQCHGDFTLSQLPFYSGFYEVRAYTKYMLNWGGDIIFSRLLPVFNKPKTAGDYEKKEMLSYGRWGVGNYPMKRERLERGKAVNLRFFPEGGNLVQGVASRIAFEVTDNAGNPIDVTGFVMDATKQEICPIATLHEGRGVFTYTPGDGKRKDVAVVEHSGKKYQFDLPAGLPQGVVMEVDNLSYPDSIDVNLRKNGNTPAGMFGVVVLNVGQLYDTRFVYITDDEINFKMDKTSLPLGVSQVVLFSDNGEILCDRLLFTGKKEWLDIHVKTDKPSFKPYELINMEISIADRETNPVPATFSLSIRDGENEVENNHTVLTDLLLMSEIKGYVRNPMYYFEEKKDIVETRRATSLLDLLLMVQGWRRYSWKQMAGIEPFDLKYLPEQGIETHGNVVSLVKQKPKPNVDVTLLLHQKVTEGDIQGGSFVENFVTDEQGRFSFVSDVSGRWNMILSVAEKGKKKDHRILLDRIFSPEPRRYSYTDLQISIAENITENLSDKEIPDEMEEEADSLFIAYQDSIAKSGIGDKLHQLPEVTVKAKRRTREQEIFRTRSTSIAYYDVASEMDDIYDKGKYVGNDIHEMLIFTNKDFSIRWINGYEFLYYKGKLAVFSVNYERSTLSDEIKFFKYKNLRLSAIKSLYINESLSAKIRYCDPGIPIDILDKSVGCVVLIETYPEGQIPVEGAKGVRKTWLEGYSPAKEFYIPNYAELPPDPDDYRRTLYWNPMVTTDESGKAKINFYNNSRCKNFSINAETVMPSGMIGIYKH